MLREHSSCCVNTVGKSVIMLISKIRWEEQAFITPASSIFVYRRQENNRITSALNDCIGDLYVTSPFARSAQFNLLCQGSFLYHIA